MKIEMGGLPVILTIVFVILKLTNVIAWSWWWVFSPILIGLGLAILGIVIALIVTVIIALVTFGKR